MENNLIAKSSISIHAPAEKVWDALVNPEVIKQYLFGSEVISDWVEGNPVIYKGIYQGKTFEDKGKVVKVEPKKRLVLTHWSPLSGTPDKPENYHTVTYEIVPQGGENLVSITQNHCASEQEREQSTQFWLTVLQGMKKLVEM